MDEIVFPVALRRRIPAAQRRTNLSSVSAYTKRRRAISLLTRRGVVASRFHCIIVRHFVAPQMADSARSARLQ